MIAANKIILFKIRRSFNNGNRFGKHICFFKTLSGTP